MRLERAVPCISPPQRAHRPRLGDRIEFLPGFILALSFAIGSVIAGLHG